MTDSTTRNLYFSLSKILSLAIEKGYIEKSNLYKTDSIKVDTNEVIFLEIDELKKVEELRFKNEKFEHQRLAFLFQCYTGFAYAEMIAFDKSKHIKDISGTKVIEVIRGKNSTPEIVPVFDKTKEILKMIDDKFSIRNNQEYNNICKFIGEIIGYPNPEKITSHVPRKTAGMLMLNEGVSIEVVAKVLGDTIQTVQRHYAKILNRRIITDTFKLIYKNEEST